MVKYEIDLVGLNPVYMKKLSIYLQKRLQQQAVIRVWEDDLRDAADTAAGGLGRIVLAGEAAAGRIRETKQEISCCCLTVSADRQACSGDVLYMYQSADSLYNRIFRAYEQQAAGGEQRMRTAAKPVILTFFGADAGAGLLPYAVTCAKILSRERHTLFVNLLSCSGMRELLGLPPAGADLSDLFLTLRRGGGCGPDAYTGLLDELEYTEPLENPGILDELRTDDLELFIDYLADSGYEAVVIAQDGLRFWSKRLIELSEQVICLTDAQVASACRRNALYAFYEKSGGGKDGCGVWTELQTRPVIPLERGMHLLHEWETGLPGELLRAMLKETGLLLE